MKIKYTSIFSHKGTLISIISWGWFPHRQGLSRFWWTDIYGVSRNIPCTSLPPFTYISANKGSSLVFSFSFIHDEVMTDVLWKVSSFTHERFLHDINWSFATCSLHQFRELLNYSFVGKVCHARVVEAIMQRRARQILLFNQIFNKFEGHFWTTIVSFCFLQNLHLFG